MPQSFRGRSAGRLKPATASPLTTKQRSAIADGNAHNHDNLPVLLAGGGGGTIRPRRHVRFAKETPMANLYVSMLERMGAPTERFGDSTGLLKELA